MGNLFSALSIGQTGLSVAQIQLDVAGNNIASVNKEGYSRQRAELLSRPPQVRQFGIIPSGPRVGAISRARDEFLDVVFRQEVQTLGQSEVRAQFFERIEDIFQEPNAGGFSENLNVFFDALNDFANNVEALPVRVSLLTQAETLADQLQTISQQLNTLRTNANEEVREQVQEVNRIAAEIAELNVTIRRTEAGQRQANDLRDERDVLLDELARIANIDYRERDNGEVDVFIGGAELVRGDESRLLQAVPNASLDPDRNDLLEVVFQTSGAVVDLTDGELFGALQARDTDVPAVDARIDSLAAALIESINSIHSQGNGLTNYTAALTSTNAVDDPTNPIDAADLPFAVQSGSFDIPIYDSNNVNIATVTVPVTAGVTTLNDIVNDINASGLVSAAVTADNRLQLSPVASFSFAFSNDSSNVLAALGVNTLLTGSDASDIGVNQRIIDDPTLLASGFSLDPTETGDNRAALALANVRNQAILGGNTQTLNEFFESTIVQIGIESNANESTFEVQESFIRDFQRRREEVSGVNLDEEATQLLQFQRAFEASSRVITTADRMLAALLAIGA